MIPTPWLSIDSLGRPAKAITHLCHLIHRGATTLGKTNGYIKIIWTHVDLGSNTHICNDIQPIVNSVPTSTGLGQVSGSKAPIHAIGDWPVILGQQFLSLPETLVMPTNPTSTLGGFALKNKSHFSRVTHEMNEYFRIEFNNDTFIFSPKTDTLRTYNGLDYVPLLMWIPQLPSTARTTPKQCNAAVLRRSNRKPTPSLKVRENNMNDSSPVNEIHNEDRQQEKTHNVLPQSLHNISQNMNQVLHHLPHHRILQQRWRKTHLHLLRAINHCLLRLYHHRRHNIFHNL